MVTQETFDDQEFWMSYGLTPDYQDRLKTIISLVSMNTESILDIGCGNGDVINGLMGIGNKNLLIGLDAFFEPLKMVKTHRLQAKLPDLPFNNKQFELVICLEVLEHLNENDFIAAISEIQRLAKNHIIIGVPYKENLEESQVLCLKCGQKSHAHGHLRSFNKKDMANLFPDFYIRDLLIMGKLQHRSSKVGIFLEHKFASQYYLPEKFICPYCNNYLPAISTKPKLFRIISKIVNIFLNKLSPVIPYWMVVDYWREEKMISNE